MANGVARPTPFSCAGHRRRGCDRSLLLGERGRTCNQLRLFASVVRAGDAVGARLDSALPERKPLPRSDLRMRRIALGPVAVFGASNFPLAFSVAGGDTASALAAGCPVVLKAHPGHPRLSALTGEVVTEALAAAGAPSGSFAVMTGLDNVDVRRSRSTRSNRS